LSLLAVMCPLGVGNADAQPAEPVASAVPTNTYDIAGGSVTFSFDETTLTAREWTLAFRGAIEGDHIGTRAVFDLARTGSMFISSDETDTVRFVGSVHSLGGILISRPYGRFVLGALAFHASDDGRFLVVSHIGAPLSALPVFAPKSVRATVSRSAGKTVLQIVGDLRMTAGLAEALGDPGLEGMVMGSFEIQAVPIPSTSSADRVDDLAEPRTGAGGAARSTLGGDVIVGSLHDMHSYGTDLVTGIAAFAIGTTSCNAGDEPLSWHGNTTEHPVIAQNMYRLADGRFEQIGMSWVKHGFATINGDSCQFGCVPPPMPGSQLGVGCSDPYAASLNGQQSNLGPRSQVNPHTGVFPYPWSAPDPAPLIGRRLQVHTDDLDPALNPGALYFVEGHYVHPEDSAAGFQNNNASYRRVSVSQVGLDYELFSAGGTSRENPAIRAWQNHDGTVTETDAQIQDDGLLIVSEKTTDLGNGLWHYEYAVQNLNADRAVRSFSVPVESTVAVSNIGFHDVDWHSGEVIDGTDWSSSRANGLLTWSTESFSTNPNANAIRWGTLYNFRFDADVPPAATEATLGLFKPGIPPAVSAETVGPAGAPSVCGNGVIQAGEECDPPNGITCDDNCARLPHCGDGILDPGEECDPPNGITCDGLCQFLPNNLCADAFPVCPGAYEGNTGTATNDGSATCGNSSTARDVWYRYTPAATGNAVFETCGASFDTVLSVHAGCPGTEANELACDDDGCLRQSRITMLVEEGETYLIRVSGFVNESGPFTLAVTGPDCAPEPPVNDICDTALPIGEGAVVFDTVGATTSPPLELGECNVNRDLWYCYQPTCNGSATVGLCGSFFDTALAVYDGCACPEAPAAFACNHDDCGAQSSLSFPVQAGESYLLRIGGQFSAAGPGVIAISCDGVGDPIRGGRMWDKWWVENDAPEPTGEHPLYPAEGSQTGSTTFRCKECHGWDYKGAAGTYASGSHFTGIGGVLGTTLDRRTMFDLVKSDAVEKGHGFENYGLSIQDTWDLVDFVLQLTIDTDAHIDANGDFIGNVNTGEVNYTTGGATACIVCHGADGTQIDAGTPSDPVWVGTVAQENPWELLHKIRFGQPGANMPSWLGAGGTDQGATDIGAYAQLNFPAVCTDDSHCDDGLFCNGAETCVDDACVNGAAPCIEQACDEAADACIGTDPIRGGRLWDTWWIVSGLSAPPGNHPLYPPAGQKSGSTTFRCKECHGWDYKGASGAYGAGDHFTGIAGVFGSTLDPQQMFDVVVGSNEPIGHDFYSFGLSERDAWDLVSFMQSLVIDANVFIDGTATFVGDAVQGGQFYTTGGLPSCVVCHGADGTQINFGTSENPEWLGTIATYNPWELMHKVRFGQPDGSMASWLADGGIDQDVADIGRYAQLSFPVDCLSDTQCDNGEYCDGAETCVDTLCTEGTNPCPGLQCDDEIDLCRTGTCDSPVVEALGGRYLGITAAPSLAPVAFLLTGDPDSPEVSCLRQYVQLDWTLGDLPIFRTAEEWGSIVVTGQAIQPGTLYKVRTDCGADGAPDTSLPDATVTPIWGDVDKNLTVNINDAFRIIKAFQGDFSLVTLEEADLEPCDPNRIANIADVQWAILAFQGFVFSDMGCQAVCP